MKIVVHFLIILEANIYKHFQIPCSHMFLKGAHICEKSKGSADEYSGSSDEQNDNKDVKDFDHTICIEVSFAFDSSCFASLLYYYHLFI